MKRELKFRAWHKSCKCMIYLDKVVNEYDYELGTVLAFSEDGYAEFGAHELYKCNTNIPDRVELMQYTGLKDKDGKEIYEGDILTDGKGNYKICRIGEYKVQNFANGDHSNDRTHYGVYFFMPSYNFEYDDQSIYYPDQSIVWNEHMKILGNIYENPELLKDL